MRRKFPAVQIHAFEPIPDNFSKLEARLSGLPRVKLHRLALGRDTGTISMFQNVNSQTSSLLENGDDNTRFFGDDTSHAGLIAVPIQTLDSWIAEYPEYSSLFVKADVQGAEGLLISGGLETFRTKVDAFYTEISLGDLYRGQADLFNVHQLLTSSTPLRLFQLYRTRSNDSGRALWLDAMWVKDDVLSNLESNTPVRQAQG
jgi:FkbM family methyltransferase